MAWMKFEYVILVQETITLIIALNTFLMIYILILNK